MSIFLLPSIHHLLRCELPTKRIPNATYRLLTLPRFSRSVSTRGRLKCSVKWADYSQCNKMHSTVGYYFKFQPSPMFVLIKFYLKIIKTSISVDGPAMACPVASFAVPWSIADRIDDCKQSVVTWRWPYRRRHGCQTLFRRETCNIPTLEARLGETFAIVLFMLARGPHTLRARCSNSDTTHQAAAEDGNYPTLRTFR